MTAPTRLEVASFPEHVQSAVEEQRWSDLVNALEGGLSVNLFSRRENLSLLAFVLSYHEAGHERTVSSIPLEVLEAFKRHGAGPTTLTDGLGLVALSGHHGQWQWAHRLLDEGWPVEAPGARSGALRAIMSGHQSRKRLGLFKSLGDLLFKGHDLAQELADEKSWAKPELPPNVHALPVPSVFDPSDEKTDRAMRRFFEILDEAASDRQSEALWERRGALSLMLRLLEQGADQIRQDPCLVSDPPALVTPLEQAIALRETDWVLALLDSPHARQGVPAGALAMAAKTGDVATLKVLLERLPVRRLQEEGAQAALACLGSGHRMALEVLANHGVSLDVCDDRGWTLAQCAAERGARSVLGYLVRTGVALEASVDHGPTPADLLRLKHPHLCPVFELAQPCEESNVRVLRRPTPRR